MLAKEKPDYKARKKELKDIVIRDSVKEMGDNAFESCINLEEIRIGRQVENIEGKSTAQIIKECLKMLRK